MESDDIYQHLTPDERNCPWFMELYRIIDGWFLTTALRKLDEEAEKHKESR